MTEEIDVIRELIEGFMEVCERVATEHEVQNSDVMSAAINLLVSTALTQPGLSKATIAKDITDAINLCLNEPA